MDKLKFLLDEDIGSKTANILREQNYNVKAIIEQQPGINDRAVLQIGLQENRIVVTLDRDFGQLVFKHSEKHIGVLFLRLRKESAENIAKIILQTVEEYGEQLKGKFTTATEYDTRISKEK